jgi:alkylation response protein AidB-like acyl-CoA dehydrogenase
MDFDFNTEQDMLRKSVAEFLKKECPSEVVKEIEDSDEGYSAKLWKKMAQLEWMGIHFPEECEGFEDPFSNLMIIVEEMGKTAFPSPFFSTVIMCGLTIMEGGSDKQKKDLLTKIAKGKLIMALALYEEDASYLPSEFKMAAMVSGEDYILNGTKMFVSDANIAQKLIVAARTDQGLGLFLVDTKDPGITVNKMPTIGKDNTCEVVFDNVAVSKGDIIGKPGQGEEILDSVLKKAAVAKCAEMLGGCQTAIQMSADYARTRIQYEVPIGAQQSIQHYLADMQIAYDTNINLFYKVGWMIDEDEDFSTDASALKGRLNEMYNFVVDRAVQIHGGVGTTREFDVGLYFRRAKAFELMLGDTQYHYEQVAQGLGL